MNIEDLISQYIDGTLSSDAEAELHHRLAVSPESRRLFRAHIMLRGVARDQRVLHTPAPDVRAKLFDRLAREEGMSPLPVPSVAPPAAKMEPPVPSPAVARRERPERRRRRALPWLIPAVIAGMFLVVLWTGNPFGDSPNPGGQLADGRMPSKTNLETRREDPSSMPPVAVQQSETNAASSEAASSRVAPAPPPPPPPDVAEGGEQLLADASVPESALRRSTPPATASARYEKMSDQGSGRDDMAALMENERHGGMSARAMSPRVMSAPPPSGASDFDALQDAESLNEGNIASADDLGRRMEAKHSSLNSSSRSTLGDGASMTDSMSSPVAVQPQADGAGADMAVLKASPTLAAESPQEKSPTILEEMLDMLGRSSASGRGMLGSRQMPSVQPLSPPLTAISLPKAIDRARLESDSAAAAADHTSPSVSSYTMAEPGPGPLTLTVGLQQHSLMSLSNSDVHLQVLLKAGVELGGGDHQVYGVISGSNYRESSTDSLIGATYNGDFYPGNLINPSSNLGNREVIEDSRNELWVGGGYRYSHEIARGWRVGVGVWTGAGARYIRVGSELPVAYQPVRWIRVEILPTVQYTTAHGNRSVKTLNQYEPRAGYVEQSQRTTVLENERELNFGIGIGAALLW